MNMHRCRYSCGFSRLNNYKPGIKATFYSFTSSGENLRELSASIFCSTRYPLLLVGQRQKGMRSLTDISTHDQEWKANLRPFDLKNFNTPSTQPCMWIENHCLHLNDLVSLSMTWIEVRGSNPWSSDHDSTFHVIEMSVLTIRLISDVFATDSMPKGLGFNSHCWLCTNESVCQSCHGIRWWAAGGTKYSEWLKLPFNVSSILITETRFHNIKYEFVYQGE